MDIAMSSTQDILSLFVGEKAEELSKYDISFLAKQSVSSLKSMGLTEKQAQKIEAVFELARRKSANDLTHSITSVRSANDAFRLMQPKMVDLDVEHFKVILMDTNCNVMSIEEISKGGLDATIVDLRVLFRKIIVSGASRFIAVHNHPSGSINPSRPDKELTIRIQEASKTMSIRFDDHVIIGRNAYFSFNEEGLI